MTLRVYRIRFSSQGFTSTNGVDTIVNSSTAYYEIIVRSIWRVFNTGMDL